MKKWIFPVVLVLLFAFEILRVYLIMPFPGSQYDNTINIAYFLSRNLWWIRLLLLGIVIWQLYRFIRFKRFWKLGISMFFILLYGLIAYFLNYRLSADKMFLQPEQVTFAQGSANDVAPSKLVIGVQIKGEAKAYPIEIIGYHHQIRDVVGGKEIMVTYCTVCRTGRVFDPVVDGEMMDFRLVGMDHFNAMFEDHKTKSWWRQATGEAITGKMKGTVLAEIPSEQMPLQKWQQRYPNALVLQPDAAFKKDYAALDGYDNGKINSDLEDRDQNPWQPKSWVVSVEVGEHTKAFDWNDLVQKKVINDTVGTTGILLVMESDNQTFHAFQRPANTNYGLDATGSFISDSNGVLWNIDGICVSDEGKGLKMKKLPAYQEFYHAYQQFRDK